VASVEKDARLITGETMSYFLFARFITGLANKFCRLKNRRFNGYPVAHL